MNVSNPVLFYFWAHGSTDKSYNPIVELDTFVFRSLVARVDVVLEELVGRDVGIVDKIESDWNVYVATGEMPVRLRGNFFNGNGPNETLFVADLMKNSHQRFLFERNDEAPFDYHGLVDLPDKQFIFGSLRSALEAQAEFLALNEPYQMERERNVAEQIMAVPNTILVLFGSGHSILPTLISSNRKVEVYYPYEGYPQTYGTQMRMHFRIRGDVSEELFLRHMMESMTSKCLSAKYGKSISSRENDLLAHHFATVLTPAQIVDFKDYNIFCSRQFGVSKGDVFESYLKRESLLLPDDALRKLRT